jgi:hypothetical protein
MGIDNTSDAQVIGMEKAQYLQNVLCDKAGTLRANIRVVDLLTSPWPDAIDGVGYYYATPFNSDLVLFVAGGNLYYASVTPGTPVPTLGTPTLTPGISNHFVPGVGVRFVAFNEELIILPADGGVAPTRFTIVKTDAGTPPQLPAGPHLFVLGIAPPTAPTLSAALPAGGTGHTGKALLNQPYTYAFTYFDEKFRESSLSPLQTITLTNAANNAVSVTPPPLPPALTDPQVRGAYVYEAVPGNSTFYRVHTFAPGDGAWLDDLPDGNVEAIPTQWVDPQNFQAYDRPHNASVGCSHKNYLFLNDVTNPQVIQASNLSSPTQFSPISLQPTEGGDFTVDSDQGDPVMAMVPYGSLMKIWKVRGFYILFGDFVSDFTIRALHMRGTVCSDSAVRADNDVLSHSLDGVYAYNYSSGFLANRLSQEIQSSFDALTLSADGQDKIRSAHAAYVDNKYFLWIDTTVFVYDFRAPKPGWTTISLTG